MRAADHAIWAIAFLFYVVDAARLLSAREVLIVEAGGRRLTASFSDDPYTLGGRVLAFAPLLLPHRGVFVAPWGRAWSDRAALDGVIGRVDALRDSLVAPRVVAVTAFALLFLVGPGLTAVLGADAAVLYTGLVVYLAVFAAIAGLWIRRTAFGLSAGKAALISAEVLACPAFLPNLVRKITVATPLDVDAAQIVRATARPERADAFIAWLERRTETLLAEAASAGGSGDERLRSYVAAVKDAGR